MKRSSPRRRNAVLIALTLTIVSIGLAYARPSRAVIPSAVVTDVPRTIFQVIDKVTQSIAKAFKISGDIAFKTSIQIFENRLVQELQTQLATVGPGQKPLFLTNPKSFFKDVTNAAAGDFIDQFTRGVTGATGPGLPLSGSRGKFLISRFLRAQANSYVNGQGGITEQCRTDCMTNSGTDSAPPSNITTMSAGDFKLLNRQAFNDRAWKITVVSYDIYGSGGTKALADGNATEGPCKDVGLSAGASTGSTWIIILGQSWASGMITPKECLEHQQRAIDNERSIAQTEVSQCLQTCQVRGSAVTNAVNSLTGTDFFTAFQHLDSSQAPAALANALSADKSDIGQLLSAAGAMTATIQSKVTGEQTNLNPSSLPVTTRVSEEVKTPAQATSSLIGIPFVGDNGQFTYTGTSVADILKSVTSFLNSPVGKALFNYFKSKCGLNPDLCKGPSNAKSTVGQLLFGSGAPTGTAGAQILFASLGQANIITGDPGQNEISITDQLSSSGLVDAQFRQAIEERFTVQQALDKHYLDPQKTFGFDKNGIEPQNGYSYRSFQYLRKFRIIPVGWELAAKYSQLFDHRDLSLDFLIKNYNVCGQDDTHRVCSRGTKANQACSINATDGTNDCGLDSNGAQISCGASPYCGLVDPNWVLKAPQTFCRRQGSGEEILAKEYVCDQNNIDANTGKVIPAGVTCDQAGTSGCTDVGAPNCNQSDASNAFPDIGRWVVSRNDQTCADAQSCISENEDGTCLAYGYCVQERQQFKFDGTQCSDAFNSCTAYKDPLGQQTAYLANTLDTRNCTADNAGCTAYCSSPQSAGASGYDAIKQQCLGQCSSSGTSCATTAECSGGGTCQYPTTNFTDNVQSCTAAQVGCHQYLQTINATNLLRNSGFETWDSNVAPLDGGLSATYDGWDKAGSINTKPITSDDTSIAGNNKAAVAASGADTDIISQIVPVGSELYERSFTLSLRAKAAQACSATLILEPNTNQADRPKVPSDDTPNISVTTSWDSYSATLDIPSADVVTLVKTASDDSTVPVYELKASIQLAGCANAGLVIDSAQLEEGSSATQYKDYGAIGAIYLNNQRVQCTAADVGCQAYTPVDGGDIVYGQVRNSNHCSQDKVGCGTFKLEPITSVPPRTGGNVQIVVPRGKICSAADVGCEEYTNLDTVALGGEGREYFKSVKQCVKPSQVNATNPQSKTFYTWIGDAALGYTLRSYDLVQSNHDAGPCVSLTIGTITDSPVCNDTDATVEAATCTASDVLTNADCTQFYDSTLATYYRLRSRTITITTDCHPYRNTIDQSDAARKNLVYYLSTKENVTCGASAAGCRAYTGNARGTTRTLLNDTFETNGTANWVGGGSSNASVNIGGHSMKISVAGPSSAAATADKVLANQFYAGRTYLVTFMAAAANATVPTISAAIGRVNTGSGTFTPDTDAIFPGTAVGSWNSTITPSGPEWHTYTVGPLTLTKDMPDGQLALRIDSGGDAYVDNVVVTEVNDHIYLVSSTVPQCGLADVGCAAYRDSHAITQYLTSFSRLCSEQVAGCEALIDTQNSSSPFSETVKNVTTPADTITTLVNNPAQYCPASAKGCNVFGLPTYGPDQKLVNYQSKYFINDPDRYASDICLDNELSCNVYTTSNNTAVYFKNPGQGVCDYRTGGDGNGQWYLTGTTQLCPIVTPPYVGVPVGPSCAPQCVGGDRDGRPCTTPGSAAECKGGMCVGDASTIGKISDGGTGSVVGQCTNDSGSNNCTGAGVCISGSNIGNSCTADANCPESTVTFPCRKNACFYLAGSCPTEQDGCTEFRDPTDPLNCRSACPLSMSLGGTPDFVDGSCVRTQCKDGKRAGQNCQSDNDCYDGTPHSCIGNDGQPTLGQPGCRSYYYLRQSIEGNAGSCNGIVDTSIGCQPFNDTTNPNLNFRGQ